MLLRIKERVDEYGVTWYIPEKKYVFLFIFSFWENLACVRVSYTSKSQAEEALSKYKLHLDTPIKYHYYFNEEL